MRLADVWLVRVGFAAMMTWLVVSISTFHAAHAAQPPVIELDPPRKLKPRHGESAESAGQQWAILIGVNDCAELDDLSFCRKDAESLAEQLVTMGFPKDNVYLLTDGAPDAKHWPTKTNIETWIRNLLGVAEEGDLVLVSFSGHGMHVDGKTYLCPTGARVDDPQRTMIPLLGIYDSLRRCQAKRKLLWVDACRNDPRPSGARFSANHRAVS